MEKARTSGTVARIVRFINAEKIAVTLFAVLAIFPMLASLGAETYLIGLLVRVMIFAIAAIGLDLIIGYGALVSFGHAAFIGIGAYAVGILGAHGVGEFWIALPVALVAAALFAWVTGIVSVRTRGIYFIMITLAFGQMAFFIASSLAPYGGDDGLTVRGRVTVFGLPVLENERVFYFLVYLCLLAAYLLCRVIVVSRFGRCFRGIRDNPTRMAALGYDVARFQLAGYVVSGTLGGLAGFLLANATHFVSPAYMSWQRSGELIIMVLFGGLGTLHGPIIGAAAYLLVEVWLAALTDHWKMIFGPVLVIIVLVARGGVLGAIDGAVARWRNVFSNAGRGHDSRA